MMTAIGDLARGLVLQRQTGALKAEVQRLTDELATGRRSDPARPGRGDTAPVAAIEIGLARAEATRQAAAMGLHRAAAIQGALGSVATAADGLARDILSLGPEPDALRLGNIAADARGRFEAVVATLRASEGGRALFGGAAVTGPAVADAATLLAAVDAAVAGAGATTPAAIAAAVAAWFDDPAGFAATGYRGSAAPMGAIPVGDGAAVTLGVTALDPGLRRTLAALAVAARADHPALPPGAGAALLREAAPLFAAAAEARVAAAATLGRAERRLAEAVAAQGAQATALALSRAELLAADPYATAVALEAAQRQVETLHAVTARLARLSLADFLR
jgi:flagellar hook-associated protein 3 FlgL